MYTHLCVCVCVYSKVWIRSDPACFCPLIYFPHFLCWGSVLLQCWKRLSESWRIKAVSNMLLCLTSSMSPPPPPLLHSSPFHPPPPPPSPWHFVFKLVWCQNRDLVTLSSAVCVEFCSQVLLSGRRPDAPNKAFHWLFWRERPRLVLATHLIWLSLLCVCSRGSRSPRAGYVDKMTVVSRHDLGVAFTGSLM